MSRSKILNNVTAVSCFILLSSCSNCDSLKHELQSLRKMEQRSKLKIDSLRIHLKMMKNNIEKNSKKLDEIVEKAVNETDQKFK